MNLLQNMKVLSDDEMYLIHMRVMETLQQIGIMVEEEASLKVLEQNGAKVNYDKKKSLSAAGIDSALPERERAQLHII